MNSHINNHSRTIIHIDIDCFYAQVEMVKNPALKDLPLGIQQKNIVVTSNYIARDYGIKKCMLISEAKKLCPNLVLVNGEDLHNYRQMSYEVTKIVQTYSDVVERLGLDENFVDVTSLVNKKIEKRNVISISEGCYTFGDTSEQCECGCAERLQIGTLIAQEIRNKIHTDLGLTTCAGIASNKLLAKLVGAKNKPNKQTVIFPDSALELMLSLDSVKNIPGIGVALSEQLESINVQTVLDLQNVDAQKLQNLVGVEKTRYLKNLSLGMDDTPVKTTGKPQSIGIEDSCKQISAESEVKDKLQQLLHRLLLLVAEDGRIPKTVKLTVRKFDKVTKSSSRETRQCTISSNLFNRNNLHQLTENNEIKIMNLLMLLFKKVVDVRKPYTLTLLGLAFTKFTELANSKSVLSKFLKKDIEVQSVTNIENTRLLDICDNNNDSIPSTSKNTSNLHDNDLPVAKKGKYNLNLFLTKQDNSSFANIDECESPSKLKVDELNLSSCKNSPELSCNVSCPPNADEEVFRELPKDLQTELWEEYKRNRERESINVVAKKPRTNSIVSYLVKKL